MNDNEKIMSLSSSLCESCCHPISDRYIMQVGDKSYHEKCLECISCSMSLMHSCFIKDGNLLCRLDYERLFGKNRCLGCGERIGREEFVMRAMDNVFHLKCFVCVVCGVRLQKGEQYIIKQSQLFCLTDYEKEVEMLQADDFYCEDMFQSRIDGRRGPKRPRTILTTQQRRAFKASFELSPKPCRKVRENLARDTGLSIRIVQVWFQNQRAKVKKIQNKARQEGGKSKEDNSQGDCDGNDTKSIMKVKDETHSDSDSFASGISHDDSYRPIKLELENEEEFFKITASFNRNIQNCEDMGGNHNMKNENMPLNTIMSLGYNSLQQMVAASQILNPIDRLYSMQNNYFKSEEMGQNLNESM